MQLSVIPDHVTTFSSLNSLSRVSVYIFPIPEPRDMKINIKLDKYFLREIVCGKFENLTIPSIVS